MSDNTRPNRTWREIAEEASREKDAKKLLELTEELERVLAERNKQLRSEREPAADQSGGVAD